MSESESTSSDKANSVIDPGVSKIKTAGDGEEFIILGNTKYYRHELMRAFCGTFDVCPHPPPVHKIGNPSAFGLCAFSVNTILSCILGFNAKGIHITNIGVGFGLFVGGLLQVLSGMWEFYLGNTFAFCSFTSYGAFYLSYGVISIPSFGIQAAYADHPEQLTEAINIFLLGWTLFTFMMLLATTKSVPAMFILFVFIFLTFFFETIGLFIGHMGVYKAGCVFGFGLAGTGFFIAWAGTANPGNAYLSVSPDAWIVSKM